MTLKADKSLCPLWAQFCEHTHYPLHAPALFLFPHSPSRARFPVLYIELYTRCCFEGSSGLQGSVGAHSLNRDPILSPLSAFNHLRLLMQISSPWAEPGSKLGRPAVIKTNLELVHGNDKAGRKQNKVNRKHKELLRFTLQHYLWIWCWISFSKSQKGRFLWKNSKTRVEP